MAVRYRTWTSTKYLVPKPPLLGAWGGEGVKISNLPPKISRFPSTIAEPYCGLMQYSNGSSISPNHFRKFPPNLGVGPHFLPGVFRRILGIPEHDFDQIWHIDSSNHVPQDSGKKLRGRQTRFRENWGQSLGHFGATRLKIAPEVPVNRIVTKFQAW